MQLERLAKVTQEGRAEAHPRGPRKWTGRKVVAMAVLVLYSAVVVIPLLFTVFASLKPSPLFFSSPYSVPAHPEFGNYSASWSQGDLLVGLINSTLVTVVAVAVSTVVSAWAAYAIVRFRPRFSRAVYLLFLWGMVVPGPVLIVPMFVLMHELRLVGTIGSIIFPYVAICIPLGFLIVVNFLRTVPQELAEAARIDGCSHAQAFWLVEFPLLRPAIATVAILNGVFVWNDFLIPLVFGIKSSLYTLQVSIVSFFGTYSTAWGLVFAAVVIAAVPLVVLYVLCNRQFIEGIVAGALKVSLHSGAPPSTWLAGPRSRKGHCSGHVAPDREVPRDA